MTILHIVKLYYPWIGGVEKVAQEMAEGVSDSADVRVLCCQPRGRGSREYINGVRVVKSGSLGMFFSMPISLTFPFLFHKEAARADILHFHFPFPLADIAYLLFVQKKCKKIVMTWHSDIWRQKKLLFFYWPLLRRFLQIADVILPTSQNVLGHSPFLKDFSHKCRVMPLFIDTKYWESLPAREIGLSDKTGRLSKNYGDSPLRHSRENGNPVCTRVSLQAEFQIESGMTVFGRSGNSRNDRKIVLCVGRLVYYKGMEYLIEAMKGIDAVLLIVGNGILERELKQKVQDAGLEKHVYFIPRCTDQELKWCYQRADIFVLPSVEKTEAFGLVQMEAMLFGLPVINTNLPTGVPSVSMHNETGFTVPPRDSAALHDAIQMLLSDEQLARKMGERGRERVYEKFKKEKAIRDLLELYEELSGIQDDTKYDEDFLR